MISLRDTCTCVCSHSPLNWFMAIKHTLAVGFRIQITVKVSFARKVRMHANWFYRKGEAYFFKLINVYTCWFYDFYYLFIDELLARRNTSVVVIWKHTMVSARLALFGVGVGISNIVAGTLTTDAGTSQGAHSSPQSWWVSQTFSIHMVNCQSAQNCFSVAHNNFKCSIFNCGMFKWGIHLIANI